MQFNTGYWHTLDREYEMLNNLLSDIKVETNLSKPLLRVDQIGTSVNEGERGGRLKQTVTLALHKGVKEIELGLSESQVRSGAASYSQEEREELREMARINKVRFTSIHSPISIGNVSGLGQGGFSEQTRQRQLDEIKQAIEFAADTNVGGAVVVHTGEFPRSVSDFEEFTEFAGEQGTKEKVHYLVDKNTGKVIQNIKEDQTNFEFYYKDEQGNKITDENKARIDQFGLPELYKDDKGNFVTYEKKWEDYEKEAKQKNIKAAELFFKETLNSKRDKVRSQLKNYETRMEKEKEKSQFFEQYINNIKSQIETASEIEKVGIYGQVKDQLGRMMNIPNPGAIPDDKVINQLTDIKQRMNKELMSYQEAIQSSQRELEEIKKIDESTVSIDKYAKDKSADSFALLGIEAMKQTSRAKKTYKQENVTDIYVAPENIFPEMGYGSHPKELIELVEKSQDQMVKLLTEEKLENKNNPYYKEGLSKEEAKELANKHIKATFDTEHLGMWKKYFKGSDKEFDKWYLEQVEYLGKSGMLGHTHLADGFGRGHANLPPGSGNLPIADAVKTLQDKGYAGTIISEGYGDPTRQETAAWAYFESPIYSAGGNNSPTFKQIHQSHYFRGSNPYRDINSPYSQPEEWKSWSDTPLD